MEKHESDKYENVEAVHDAVRDSVAESLDIREEVRDITVAALVRGQLEPERFKRVIKAVLEGAGKGAALHGVQGSDAMRQALHGIDDAVSKIAVASKFAIEEAAGHSADFTKVDMRRALDDLAALETLFMDTLKELGRSGAETTQEIVRDFLHHAVDSGTAVSRQVAEALADLQLQLEQAGKAGFRAGLDAAESTGAGIARLASGFLEGLAESLKAHTGAKKHRDD